MATTAALPFSCAGCKVRERVLAGVCLASSGTRVYLRTDWMGGSR